MCGRKVAINTYIDREGDGQTSQTAWQGLPLQDHYEGGQEHQQASRAFHPYS